jgi:hypothetical protein
MKNVVLTTILLVLAFSIHAQQNENIITINIPAAENTWLTGINNNEDLCGYYEDISGRIKAFTLSKDGELRFITVQGQSDKNTYAMGINDEGVVVGVYHPTNQSDAVPFIAYPDSNGVGIEYDFDLGGVTFKNLNKINNNDCIVGSYGMASQRRAAYRCPEDNFTSNYRYNLTLPTYGQCINDAGDIAGFYIIDGETRSFIRRQNGNTESFTFPESNRTRFWGCNNNDVFVGDIHNNVAYIFELVGGGLYTRQITLNNATSSLAMDINDDDIIVGYYTNSSGKTQGFVYKDQFTNGFNPLYDGWNFDNTMDNLFPESVWIANDYRKDTYMKKVHGRNVDFQVNPYRPTHFFHKTQFPTWEQFVRLVGPSNVYLNEDQGILKERAFRYWAANSDSTWGGSCLGMSFSALLYKQMKDDLLAKYPMNVSGDLYSNNINSSIRNQLNDIQALINLSPFSWSLQSFSRDVSSVTIQKLKEQFVINQPHQNGVIVIGKTKPQSDGGSCNKLDWSHAIVPYELLRNSDDTHTLFVYDPNKPGDDNQAIEINQFDIWSYDSNANADSAAIETNQRQCTYNLYIYGPASSILYQDPYFRANEVADGTSAPLNLSRSGNLLHTFNKGAYYRALDVNSNQAGFMDGELIFGIEGAEVPFIVDRATFNPNTLVLPQQNFSLMATNILDESCIYQIFGERMAYVYDIPNNNEQEEHFFNATPTANTYVNNSGADKEIALTAIQEGDGYELIFTISDLTVGDGQYVGMELINESQLIFTNLTNDAALTLNISMTTSSGTQNFQATDIPISNDSEYLIIPDLANFANGSVSIHVDNGMDGTVNDIITFNNELPAILFINTTALDLNNAGGESSFMINNAGSGTLNWTISQIPEWIEFTTAISGSGNSIVNFNYAPNPSSSENRTGYIVVNAPGAANPTDSVLVVQGDFALSVQEDKIKSINASLYPNPSTSIVNLRVLSTRMKRYQYQVIDLSGRVCKSGELYHMGGGNVDFQINVANIDQGVYRVLLINSDQGESISLPFVKIND